MDEEIELELMSNTRGRGGNPHKKSRPTSPQQIYLSYPSKLPNTPPLNLKLLLRKFKPYFGLILSKLYGGQSLDDPAFKLSINPQSILGELLKHKINKHLTKFQKFDLYSAGSKINQLFFHQLKVKRTNIKEREENSKFQNFELIINKISRKFKPNWSKISKEIPNLTCPIATDDLYSNDY